MNIKTVDFTQASADQTAAYVKLDDISPVVDALEKLVWQVHFGKSFDASHAATHANEVLRLLKAA